MLLLRWPAFVVLGCVLAFVLFKVFVYLLNSRHLRSALDSVANPEPETPEEVVRDLIQAREQRDEAVQRNQSEIDSRVNEINELRRN